LLAFTGDSSPETNQHKLYSAADILFNEYQQLSELILTHGFPHHLAVAGKDIIRELAEVCGFLGVEFFNPA